LSLPKGIGKKVPQSTDTSYLFSNPKTSVKKISTIVREGGLRIAKEHTKFAEDYAENIKYYIHDGIYHLLSQTALGLSNKNVFNTFINEVRKFSGHDKTFAAHIQSAWD
jgi:hypothetical protein